MSLILLIGAALVIGALALFSRPRVWTLAEFDRADPAPMARLQEEAAALAETHDPGAQIMFVSSHPILGGGVERHQVVTNSRKLYEAWRRRELREP